MISNSCHKCDALIDKGCAGAAISALVDEAECFRSPKASSEEFTEVVEKSSATYVFFPVSFRHTFQRTEIVCIVM